MTTAETTLANIRPNALRIVTLSKQSMIVARHDSRAAINAKEVLTPGQRSAVRLEILARKARLRHQVHRNRRIWPPASSRRSSMSLSDGHHSLGAL
jgi:hypothetical protein